MFKKHNCGAECFICNKTDFRENLIYAERNWKSSSIISNEVKMVYVHRDCLSKKYTKQPCGCWTKIIENSVFSTTSKTIVSIKERG
jgi:hypothetical protein